MIVFPIGYIFFWVYGGLVYRLDRASFNVARYHDTVAVSQARIALAVGRWVAWTGILDRAGGNFVGDWIAVQIVFASCIPGSADEFLMNFIVIVTRFIRNVGRAAIGEFGAISRVQRYAECGCARHMVWV